MYPLASQDNGITECSGKGGVSGQAEVPPEPHQHLEFTGTWPLCSFRLTLSRTIVVKDRISLSLSYEHDPCAIADADMGSKLQRPKFVPRTRCTGNDASNLESQALAFHIRLRLPAYDRCRHPCLVAATGYADASLWSSIRRRAQTANILSRLGVPDLEGLATKICNVKAWPSATYRCQVSLNHPSVCKKQSALHSPTPN